MYAAEPAAPSAAPSGTRPQIRLLHHMARTGGTLISKCLGSMAGIALLSEIHPAGVRWFNPLQQAHEWFGLLQPADLAPMRAGQSMAFPEALALIELRARQRGLTLVVRDWSHLDFTGVPFVARPSYRLGLAEALAPRFEVIHTATVRHPVDQWLSLSALPVMRGKITLGDYLRGYRRFAETAARIGFLRYEDFAADPDTTLATLCARLRVPFDPGYRQRWMHYVNITGDTSKGAPATSIELPRRKPCDPGLIAAFDANADYRAALGLLGYGHPQ